MEDNNTLPAILEEYREGGFEGQSNRDVIEFAVDDMACRLFAAYAATEACYEGTLKLSDEEQGRVREGARTTMLEAARVLNACAVALHEM